MNPLLAGLLLLAALHAGAAPFQVRLLVDGQDTNKVYSYLARELRSLGDVELTTLARPDYTIQLIVAADTSDRSRRGYAISYLAAEPMPVHVWPLVISDTNQAARVADLTKEFVHVVDLGVFTASPDELKRVCANIGTAFDTRTLERARSERERWQREFSALTNSPTSLRPTPAK